MLSLNRGDRGLSLLEVMVATSLLLGSLFATVSAMDSGVKAAAAAERRVKATALAERDLEQLRSLPYHRIGLQRGGPGWTPTFDDATSVAVELPAFDATSVVVDSGVTFTISRHVTWAGIDTQALGPMEGAYKKLTVVVRWPGAGGGSVRLESAVSPYFQADVCSQRSVGAAAQDLSGIVNAYLPGTAPAAAGAEEVQVGVPQGAGTVAAGDVVLVVQMEGADAGIYEYALATSSPAAGRLAVTGLGADGGLLHAYGATGRFQVVRVVNAGRVVVTGTVVPLPWNGSVGGVVAVDATEDLSFQAPIIGSDAGLDRDPPAGYMPSSERLLPGGREGLRGGALVLVRTRHLTGNGLVISSGFGGGGTVAVLAETGGLEQMTVAARGIALGGGPGALLASSPPLGVDVTGFVGSPGTVATDLAPDVLTGVSLAAGCLPGITTRVDADRAQVSAAGGSSTVTYTVTVVNAPGRGAASSLALGVALPEGVQYVSGDVRFGDGVTRGATEDPSPGTGTPSWGTFTVPADTKVVITVVALVTVDTPPGPSEVVARARYVGTSGPMVSLGRGGQVTVVQFSCPASFTDPPPPAGINGVVNTYYPLTADVPAGATQLPIGAATGASSGIRAGDLLLVHQTSDSDGAREGTYEYATAVAVASGKIRINGYGAGGGLINAYRSGASSRSAQVVRVPTYRDASLAIVESMRWNGSTGGIVAIDVAGVLDLAGGSIDVRSAGSSAPLPDEEGAPGAGGSSWGAGGSGGGGGAGDGGRGGALMAYGAGGQGRAASIERARRGAPGGRVGLIADDASGPRGGVVLLRAAAMTGSGSISANGGGGLDASALALRNAGGGGGAGGTVVVAAPSAAVAGLSVSARGGEGGSANFGSGGGGGGGGGVVYLPAAAATVDVSGGAKGSSGTIVGADDGASGVSALFSPSAIPGTPLGVGCQPVPLVGASAETPTVFRTGSQTAKWTISAVNLNGQPAITNAALTARLPAGATLTAAPATITLGGGAVRTSVSNPPAGATLPAWGTFDIPSGGSVWITFTAAVTMPPGVYDLPAVLTGSGPDGQITAGQAPGSTTTDDLTVVDPSHPTVFATSVDDRLDGSSSITRFALDGHDAVTYTTGAFGPTPSTGRYLDIVQATDLYPATSTVLPGALTRVRVAFAAPAAGVAACVYAQVFSVSTGALITDVGSDASPLGCVIGTTQTTFDAVVPAASWSGVQLDDLRLRLIGWVAGGGALVVDRAGFVTSWAGADVSLRTATLVDASTGTPAAPNPNPLTGWVGGSRVDVGGTAIAKTFSGSRFVDWAFPAVVPTGSQVTGAKLRLGWSSDVADGVCWYAEIRTGSALIATVGGSAASPTCRADASVGKVDEITLPALSAAQARDLRARVFFRTTGANAKWIRVDQAAISISWARP